MAKLSALDQAFFLLETHDRPMNVGALVVLAPPAGLRGDFGDWLLKRWLSRPVGPPFNHLLKQGRLSFLPEIHAASDVDPARQVHRLHLSAPATREALFEKVCELHVKPLPRQAPLWEMYVLNGLPDGRLAVYFKTHHGIIDGLGFMKAFIATVSSSPRSRKVRAIWEGIPGEGGRTSPGPQATELVNAAAGAARTAVDLVRLFNRQGQRSTGTGHGLTVPFVRTPDSFKDSPSVGRVLAYVALPLPKLKALARNHDAKVNDVIMTVLDMAMLRYLDERGARPDRPLVADMPVALSKDGKAGNQITILAVPLGAPDLAPAERLRAIVRETAELKGEVRALSGGALAAQSIIAHSLASAIESLGLEQLPMLANTVISNPYGLEQRQYLMGAPVEFAIPVSVVAHHQTLNITATTYVDILNVTFIAMRHALPDVQKIADYTLEALDELERDLGRSGRSARAKRVAKAARKPAGRPPPARVRRTPSRAGASPG